MLGADDFKNLRHVSCENFAKLKLEFLGHMEEIMFLLFFLIKSWNFMMIKLKWFDFIVVTFQNYSRNFFL